MPPEPPSSSLRLALDKEALVANWAALDRLSGKARAGAAVKANAYGLGATTIVPVLRSAGCEDFFVAHWTEAAELSGQVEPGRIAVLSGPLTAQHAAYAKAVGLRPVINSLHQARLWLAAGGGPCDLMVDTGMNRLGLALDELGDETVGRLEIDVLHSHLASSDQVTSQNEVQRRRWDEARTMVRHTRAALANSAGITLGSAYHGDLTRPGLALYGGVPCAALGNVIRQVARPEVAVLQVRMLGAGDTVGYNATFVAPGPMRIGVVSLGYADGYLRCWSGKGTLRSSGRTLKVIGRVSMDLAMIDLAAAPDLVEGDWVEVDYSLPEAARISGLSQYELLTLLGRRFVR